MSKWTTTKLIAAGSLGVLMVIFDAFGAIINATTGIVGAGGIINAFLEGILFAFCCLTIKKFGAATIAGFVFGVSALPLPIIGTPGFLPKIIVGISAGLVADIIYLLLKKNEKIAAIGIGVGKDIVIFFGVVGFGLLLSMPGIKEALSLSLSGVPLAPLAAIVYPLLGGTGGYVGYLTYNKLENTSIIKRIQTQNV